MSISISKAEIELGKTLKMGQAFRWVENPAGVYKGVVDSVEKTKANRFYFSKNILYCFRFLHFFILFSQKCNF